MYNADMKDKRSALKRQLNRTYFFAVFIPIILIGVYLVYNNYNLILSHHEEMLVSDNLRVRSIIFEVTTSMTNICSNIGDDKSLKTLLVTEFENPEAANEVLNAGTVIDEFYGRHTELASVTVYTNNQTLVNHKHIMVLTPEQQKEEWYTEAIGRTGYYWQTKTYSDKYGTTYHNLELTYKLPIIGNGIEALLVIDVSSNFLKNRIDNNNLDVDLSTDEGRIFFSTREREGQTETFFIDYEPTFYQSSEITELWGDSRLVEVSSFKPIKTDDRIYILSTNPSAIPETRKVTAITLITIMISLLIPYFIIIKYNGQLTNRVNTLKGEMHRVSEGNYDIIENFKGNDELVELFNDLKRMIVSIKSRDQAIYDAKIKEQLLINHQQKMEMALLSSKINPHFLYNTLETIRMKAFAVGALEVAEAVKLLGRYMRHNLESSGELVSLGAELQFIEVYLAIQKLRFTSRIDYRIHIGEDVETEKTRLLPLLIQPIVENAFLHGHEETVENGIIDIQVIKINNDLEIAVRDNGTGMSDERLEWIHHRLASDIEAHEGSIGLFSIHQRLRLYYGDTYGITVANNSEGGACISIRLPYEEENGST